MKKALLAILVSGLFCACISLPLPTGEEEGLAAGRVKQGYDLSIFFRNGAGETFLAATQRDGWLLSRLPAGDYTVIKLSLTTDKGAPKTNLPLSLPVHIYGGAVNNLGDITVSLDGPDFQADYQSLQTTFREYFEDAPWNECLWVETVFFKKEPVIAQEKVEIPVVAQVKAAEARPEEAPKRPAASLLQDASALEAEAAAYEEAAALLRQAARKLREAAEGAGEPQEQVRQNRPEKPAPSPSSSQAPASPPPPSTEQPRARPVTSAAPVPASPAPSVRENP